MMAITMNVGALSARLTIHMEAGAGGDQAWVKGTRMIGVGVERVTVAKLAELSGGGGAADCRFSRGNAARRDGRKTAAIPDGRAASMAIPFIGARSDLLHPDTREPEIDDVDLVVREPQRAELLELLQPG